MTSLIQDLRYAFRTLLKCPAFSTVAIATLALGIGANAAIFALVDRVMLRLLPVRDPQELVLLRSPGRAVSSILFGVGAANVEIFAAGLILMTTVALAAALPPALRAGRLDATDALRSE